ncbi:MAG: sugar phosphate isomerase/epimerase family protein [Planctomycetaceae bacterium]
MPTRRSFLAAAGCSVAGLSGALTVRADEKETDKEKETHSNSLCVFTKPFNSLTFEELATKTAELGFQGIEAPIRNGGHIEPDAVPDRLPALQDALQKHGLQITVMTSDINDPNDAMTETVLKAAVKAGVRYYRMKYFRYDESRSIANQVEEWKSALKDLAALNRELGITAVYQNHAGRGYFGSMIWDLHRALDGIDPEHVGVAYDIRHATVEAGMSWPIGWQLIQPHVQVVYVKDFAWDGSKPTNVPLGQGRVDSKFFKMLARSKFQGPISLHEEYLDHTDPSLVPRHWTSIAADLKTLQSWLK